MNATGSYDVVVVGAGVIGSAIARDLARTHLSVLLVDARSDVGDGTSKANTAILHTGYDATPGTLESRLVAEGYHLLKDYAHATNIGLEEVGAVLVAWTDDELEALPGLKEKAERNGYLDSRIVDADDVYAQLPHLGTGVLGGLRVPGESIICTWTTTLALATEAVRCGARLMLSTTVAGVEVGTTTTVRLVGDDGETEVTTRWLVNAAGLGGDTVDAMLGYDRVHQHPRRGELLVFDKLARPMVDAIVLPVPSKLGKGVLVSPTVYGNVMLGPTAEDMTDRSDTATTEEGFEFLRSKGERIMPDLLREEVTTAYAGLRAAHDLSDYLIEADTAQRYVVATGIRSTGLTSCMAVSRFVREILGEAGEDVAERDDLPPVPVMPTLAECGTRPFADETKIAADPAYGTLVCFCERVSAGEIADTFASTIPPRTVGGVRRRTRAMNGRCQGFFCGASVEEMVDQEGEVQP